MGRGSPPVVVVRGGGGGGAGVLLVVALVLVALYVLATNARSVVAKLDRGAVEAAARFLGMPDDVIDRASDGVLRELVSSELAIKGKEWGTRAAVALALTLAFQFAGLGWGLVGLGVVGAYKMGQEWARSRGGAAECEPGEVLSQDGTHCLGLTGAGGSW